MTVAANYREDFAGEVTRAAGRRHEYVRGRDLLRLRGAFHGRLRSEACHILSGRSAGLNGIHTGPGAITFTRMPRSIRWEDSERAKRGYRLWSWSSRAAPC